MSDPISGLQGKPDPSELATPTPSVTVTPLPPVREVQYTQGQPPQEMMSSSTSFSPPPPEPFIPPASGSQLEGGMSGPMAPPPELAGQSAFSLSLPGAINPAATEAASLIAPTQTGNQQALRIVGPGVQKGIEALKFERGERYTGAMDPAAVGYQRTWEPPDIDASISNFGSQMGVLRESYKVQTAQRQNESERAWLERNMAAIENMSKPPGSATGNSMEWVNQMLGISEDGNRQYVGAAVFDKSKGEWRGSAIGGVLYSLGILQNSAMGGLMDVTNIFRNVDKGLKAAYENFTPPWARSGTDNALRTLGNLFPILPLLRKLPSTGKYDDGKSNFVEALRGAQYSFSDKAGKGFGIDFNTGFKLSTDIKDYTGNPGGGFSGPAFINPKSGKGIDINPGVIAGIGLDFVFGAKVDRLATAAAKRLGIRLPGVAQAAAPAQATAPTPPTPRTSVFQPTQLNIPFMSGPVKAGKQAAPQVPAALKAVKVPKPPAPPKGDVQAVLPIAAMMDEFGVADRLINPKAYKGGRPNKSGQLQLDLGPIERSPASRGWIKPKSNTPRIGKQLALQFDALPEALIPKPTVSPVTTAVMEAAENVPIAELPPAVQGAIYNKMKRQLEGRMGEIESRMASSLEPDIGRRLDTSPPRDLPPSPPPTGKGAQLRSIAVEAPPDLYHGTRVENLDIPRIDPVGGAAYSELGPGVYMTPDKNVAITASGALASEGLPGSKSFLPAGVGDVHKLGIDPNALIIDGAKPHPVLEQIASDVAAGFPSLRGTSFKGNNLVEILERAAVADNSQGGRQAFQEALTVALRNEGVDGVKVGDNIAMYNTQRVIPKSKEVVPHLSTPENLADAKYTLEEWGHGQTKSAIAKANSLDTEALAVAQRIKALEGTKDELANKVFKEIETAGLFEHPPRVSGVAKEGSTTVDNWTKYPNLEAAMEALPPGTLPTNAIDAMSTVNGKLNNSTRDALTAHFWDDLVDLTPGTPLKDGWADRLGVPRDTPLEDLAKLDPSPSMVEAVSRELDEYAQHLYCP